jgi:hypothetical protein
LCRALTCISPPARPSETRSPPQTTGEAEFRGLPPRAGLLRCPAATMASTRWPENWRTQRDGEAQSQQTDELNTAPATTERFSRKRAALRCEDAAPLHHPSYTSGLNREARLSPHSPRARLACGTGATPLAPRTLPGGGVSRGSPVRSDQFHPRPGSAARSQRAGMAAACGGARIQD